MGFYYFKGGVNMEKKDISQAAREKRNAYMREYRKRPGMKEKQAQYNIKYWEKVANQELDK